MADVHTLSAAKLWVLSVIDCLIKVWRSTPTRTHKLRYCASGLFPDGLSETRLIILFVFAVVVPSQNSSNPGMGRRWHCTICKCPTEGDHNQEDDSLAKLAELAVSLMQDIFGEKVQLVPSGDALCVHSQWCRDLISTQHCMRAQCSNEARCACTLWTHANVMFHLWVLSRSVSKPLLTWLLQREAELVVGDRLAAQPMRAVGHVLRWGSSRARHLLCRHHSSVFCGTHSGSSIGHGTGQRTCVCSCGARWQSGEEAPMLLTCHLCPYFPS
jgi:hypothetical protein